MAKGEDSVIRKKNKALRKKQNRKTDAASVSSRVAAIIAAKKRRQSGKRRLCQGMCFSLPTLEDPYNDGRGKLDLKGKKLKKFLPSKVDQKVKHLNIKQRVAISDNMEQKIILQPEEPAQLKQSATNNQNQASEHHGCPSKFLFMCLKSIESELRHGGLIDNDEGKPLLLNKWGFEFWKCYSAGQDTLESCGSSTVEQIAWIAATAADDITRKEKEGQSLPSPFLLHLVPSQDKAIKVRTVCKSLKGLGVHTVSLHSGATVDHQIHGLKSCEPEFLVSTPDRLLELIDLNAIDISGVSLLVLDGLDMLIQQRWFDTIKIIIQLISKFPHTVVFNDSLDHGSHTNAESLIGKSSLYRLS